MNPSFSPRRLLFGFLLAALVPISAVTAAPAKGDDPVSVPASFLQSRMVRPVGAPATTYRVIIDVPPAASARTAQPKIAQSSGDGAVDGIAWDYVKQTLRKSKAMAEQNRTHELRFPLRLVPPAISPGKAPMRAEFRAMPKQGVSTPFPWYPPNARQNRVTGDARVRASFPASGGHPRFVVLEEGTGDHNLDEFTVLWALLTWQAAPSPSEQTITKEFSYRLRQSNFVN